MVNLKAEPFHLSRADRRWVQDTIASMSDEEKVGQLFFAITASYDESYLKELVDTYHVGGCRYNSAPGQAVRRHNEILQQASKLPLFIAANTEAGGSDACADGTYIGSGIKIGAAGQREYAYELGKMANEEASAVGCNMAFAPVCDIAYNWQNTEVISRAFGSDPKQVLDMSLAYLQGAHTIPGFACVAKHFPGNGRDFRDAHLSNNVNDMSVKEWNATYGKVYKALIKDGLEAVMAGHIMLPSYARELNPRLTDDEIMPATLSPEMIGGLLRGKLGFHGLVITDATHMVGMTCRMKRSELLPRAINAGCDMLLFFNDPEEDFETVLSAYRNGIISTARMEEALTRILGMKAHMGLHRREGLVPLAETVEQTIHNASHQEMQRKISEDAITLVKYKDADVLPVTLRKYPRILLVHVKGTEGGMTALKRAVGIYGGSPVDALKKKLEDKGFQVSVYENPLDKMAAQARAGEKPDVNEFFAGKSAVSGFTAQMDMVITVCDVVDGRPVFGLSKGGGEIPWYVFEVPTIVVSCGSPTILADIPQARTYINLYDAKDATLDAFVDKLMSGPAAFRGRDPIDSFCGLFDTHL